jgi:hypothetical protein
MIKKPLLAMKPKSAFQRKDKDRAPSIVERKGDKHLTSQFAVGERRLIKVTEPHFVNRTAPRFVGWFNTNDLGTRRDKVASLLGVRIISMRAGLAPYFSQ